MAAAPPSPLIVTLHTTPDPVATSPSPSPGSHHIRLLTYMRNCPQQSSEEKHEKSLPPFLSEGETDNEEPPETTLDFAVGASLQARSGSIWGKVKQPRPASRHKGYFWVRNSQKGFEQTFHIFS